MLFFTFFLLVIKNIYIPLCCVVKNKEDLLMKKLLFSLAFIVSCLVIQAADITPISDAMKAGNADMLKDKMGVEVDVAVPGNSKKGTGNDAIAILKTFFQANKPTGFTIAHHADKNDSGFFVGKLATGDKEFRVNITYIAKDGKTLITVIRIE